MNESRRWSRQDWLTMTGSALVVVLVAALIAGAASLVGSGPAAGAVTLESAGASGADPFTASIQISPAVEFPGNVQAITAATRRSMPVDPNTHTLVAAAATPGLYGGSGDAHVCDTQQLVVFLGQHSDKAAAWASVLGISTNDIASYVESLTPVVLTSDTLVTNHGYRDGHATTLQSVLQAGTAVMVDAYGVPRVKCNCGNPLTPPEFINPAHYQGTAWPGYSPTQVTVVHSGPTIVNLTVLNISTGDTYQQPTSPKPARTITTTTSPASSSLSGIDWMNYTYLDRTCGNLTGKHLPVHLTNGKYESSDGYSNPPGTADCGMTIDDIKYADVTGDGVPDVIITGSAFFENIKPWLLTWTTVFTEAPTGPKNLGYFDGTAYPPYSAAGGITVWSGIVGDVLCCAGSYKKTTYRYSIATKRFAQTAHAVVPPGEAPAPIVKASGGG
ncbi:MAG: hypothetical protein QOI44_1084 [Actinomycetota bacterium]|nr:hypothetical protein [Actinomycetota bacterium]